MSRCAAQDACREYPRPPPPRAAVGCDAQAACWPPQIKDSMNTDTIDAGAAEPLRRLTVRLPASDFEELREAAFEARRRPAEVARAIIMAALAGETPARPTPAPPAPEEMPAGARALLAVCAATISNLTQVAQHAADLGFPQAQALGDELRRQAGVLRNLGLSIKAGAPAPSGAPAIVTAAETVNELARALNTDARSVPPQAWTPPLSALRTALAALPG